MTKVPYDTSKVRPRRLAPAHDWQNGGDPGEDVDPGSFAARVALRRVDLVALVNKGIPPRQYHACSEGMLVKGKRHMIAAPTGEGKSLVFLVHAVRMALAGERIALLDRENGPDEYSDRLSQIMDSWQLTKAQRTTVQRNLGYYEFPALKRNDAAELVGHFKDADLVAFDSQRMYLSDLGLRESDTDDYAEFMARVIDPLYMAGITTVILDNVGHGHSDRPRGTSSKRDLNEVLFELREVQAFDRTRRGVVKLEVKKSRFGDRGSWRMAIGGGVFGEWQSDAEHVLKIAAAKPEFKSVAYEVLRAAGGRGVGVNKVAAAVRDRGVKISNTAARESLNVWAADSEEPVQHDEKRGYWIDDSP